jgi:hypothetical protein
MKKIKEMAVIKQIITTFWYVFKTICSMFTHVLKLQSDISYRSPIPKKKKTGTLEHIAQQHEECLRSLSSSNLTLAQSVLELATKLKRKRPVSAALQFKF